MKYFISLLLLSFYFRLLFSAKKSISRYRFSTSHFMRKHEVEFFKHINFYFVSASSMAFAAVFPAPMAKITVAAPVTASPPA